MKKGGDSIESGQAHAKKFPLSKNYMGKLIQICNCQPAECCKWLVSDKFNLHAPPIGQVKLISLAHIRNYVTRQ
jgi:hypothetical protein